MQSVTINGGLEKLTRRLAQFRPLPTEERLALAATLSVERAFDPREEMMQERRAVDGAHLIVEGFACRCKLLADGRRQILGILLPGDLCGLRGLLVGRMNHSVVALSQVRASLLPAAALTGAIGRHPRLARALWWLTALEESISREWLVNVGYRNAYERVAHLLCELYWRLAAVGLAQDDRCRLPLTQTELGDAVALSAVHINRTLMGMRRAGLVRMHGGTLELLDRDALQAVAGFDPAYLLLPRAAPSRVAGVQGAVIQPVRAAPDLEDTHNAG